ncbi:MAG: helix-turn-helix transcriptional regulator [Clostridia bacterium]|nr:helix-turn-helix transcriptional regulator [Clostridia bacterium]
MEFSEKLLELRLKEGITQEELAAKLFVSRTAVSKWESGRGYPNIESLKQISNLFSVTIDELLSGEALLSIAEKDKNQTKSYYRDLVFSLSDIFASILLFLPLFAERYDGIVHSVSLMSLTTVSSYLKILYLSFVIITTLFGILILSFRSFTHLSGIKNKSNFSLLLSAVGIIIFTVSLQPYAALFLFSFFIIKIILTQKVSLK